MTATTGTRPADPAAPVRPAPLRPLLAFDVEVRAVHRLPPTFRRLTFGGACLADVATCGEQGPRDLRIKLVVPAPGHPLPDLSDLSEGWYRTWLALDPRTRGSLGTYTVRALRPAGAATELDVDVVLHLDAHGPGRPACTWAASARPGDRITLLGPSTAAGDTPAGIEWAPPATAASRRVRVLLAGDETAVPAVSSVLEGLPEGYDGHALLEVPHPGDVLDLRAPSGMEVTWLLRGDRPHGAALRAAVREVLVGQPCPRQPPVDLPPVDVDAELLWETAQPSTDLAGRPGAFYAWVAGEAATVRDLRRCLVQEHGVDRRDVAFMGYWRRGRAEGC